MRTTTIVKPITTQVAKAVAVSNSQVAEICAMLNWSTDQYFEHQYEQYEEFLKRAFYGQRELEYNEARYSPLMRGLWNNAWINRNAVDFLPFGRDFYFSGIIEHEDGDLVLCLPLDNTLESLVDEYLFIHNAKRLYNDHDFMCQFYHVLTLIAKL